MSEQKILRYARFGVFSLLVVHLAVTLPSLYREGWLSPFPPFDQLLTYQIFSDLACALTLFFVLAAREFHHQRRSPSHSIGLLVGIVLTGSITPMIWLLLDRPLLEGLLTGRR